MSKRNPCKECTKRELHCHSNCQPYIDWHEYIVKEKEQLREERNTDALLTEMHIRRTYRGSRAAVRRYYKDRT